MHMGLRHMLWLFLAAHALRLCSAAVCSTTFSHQADLATSIGVVRALEVLAESSFVTWGALPHLAFVPMEWDINGRLWVINCYEWPICHKWPINCHQCPLITISVH